MAIFGGKEIAELRNKLAIGESQYLTVVQERDRLAAELRTLQAFMDAHGGREVWEMDQVAETTRAELQRTKEECAQELQQVKNDCARELQQIKNKYEQKQQEVNELLGSVRPDAEREVQKLREEKKTLEETLYPMRILADLEEVGATDYEHPAKDSIELATTLQELRKDVQAAARGGNAVGALSDIELPDRKPGRTKIIKDVSKLALNAFNSRVDTIIEAATVRNYEASLEKIFKAAENIEKLTTAFGVRIKPRYIEQRS